MLRLPVIAIRALVASLWRRVRFGPVDPAWSWRTSTMRDVLAALTDEVIMVPPWIVPFLNRFIVSGTPVSLGRVVRLGKADLDGVYAEVLTRPESDLTTVLFLHGGATSSAPGWTVTWCAADGDPASSTPERTGSMWCLSGT